MAINFKQFTEALKGGQKKLDVDKDGKIEASDLKKLRKEEAVDEGTGSLKPGWMLKKDPELAKKVKEKTDLAKKRQSTYGDKSAGKSVGEDTKPTYSQFLNYLDEAKKAKEDDNDEEVEGEKGEEKISYRADKVRDKIGRMRPRNLKGIKVHDGDQDDDTGIREAVEELDEGETVKTSTGIKHKGTYGSEYSTDREGNEKKKTPAPAEKRGRGRPKKGSDSTGDVKKYTFSDLLNRISKPTK